MIPDTLQWRTWDNGVAEHSMDISDTVQKIRSKYAQRIKKSEGWQNDT